MAEGERSKGRNVKIEYQKITTIDGKKWRWDDQYQNLIERKSKDTEKKPKIDKKQW